MRPSPPNLGDGRFLGVNELLPPLALAEGEVPAARNNRVQLGEMEPRWGCAKLPWTNRVTTGVASAPVPFGILHGVGRFRDADDIIWGIIAADHRIYRTRESNGATELSLPSGVSIDGPVHFEQAYNGLFCFRGYGQTTLLMRTLDSGWVELTSLADNVDNTSEENPSDGTETIPNADRGSWIGGRMFVPFKTSTEKDMVAISDYLNGTRYAPIRSQARINQGSADELLAIVPFGKATSGSVAACFKAASIYALYGVQGDLTTMAQDLVTPDYGLCGTKAYASIGRDEADAADEIWFLAMRKGICRLTYDRDGRLGVSRVLPSDLIQRTIDRINWEVAKDTAAFTMWDQRFYAALPLDDAETLGPNLVSGSYDVANEIDVLLIPGETYRWTPGANDTALVNDSETYDETSTFVAAKSVVTLNGYALQPCTASLQRVFQRTNNAVVVFDFRTGYWQGVDDGAAIAVQDWLVLPFSGAERLFFLGADGFINLYEELAHDEVGKETLISAFDGFVPGTWIGYLEVPVTAGKTYIYELIGPTQAIGNGNVEELITYPLSGTFIAAGDRIALYGAAGAFSMPVLMELSHTITQQDIDHDWTTRAYKTGLLRQRQVWARLEFKSQWPSLTVEEVTEGISETVARVSNHTKSRTRYERPFDRAAWNETNVNDDHATRNREDYAILLAETTTPSGSIQAGLAYYVESADVTSACSISYNGNTYNNGQTFTGIEGETTFSVLSGSPAVYPPGSYVWLGANGIDLDLHQDWDHDVRLRGRGGQVQIRVRNQQGRCVTKSVGVYTVQTDTRPGRRT